MTTIKIMDPVTRIEGHMKVEVTIDAVGGVNQVVDARCTGTLFRGFEILLKGRKPIDATVITQRICGVCPISHSQAAVLALESTAGTGYQPPTNARLLRNLILGANFVQSHILHFYVLAALDYIKGPAASPWKSAWLDEKMNLPAMAAVASHLPQALEARRQAHEMGAVFGGRMPSSHTNVPGGFTATVDAQNVQQFRQHLDALIGFIDNVYLPDVDQVAQTYPEYFNIGVGCRNLMAYGVFEEDNAGSTRLLGRGFVNGAGTQVNPDIASGDITESVTYSWYADATSNLSPVSGDTQPEFTQGKAYSWLKAPRLKGGVFEVGPLARMWVNGDYQQGISVMDRHAARAVETRKVALAMRRWLDELDGGPVHDAAYDQFSGIGIGLTEAPRGALGHWVNIGSGTIDNYQVITPTCWNASPRDDQGVPGPMEQALIGTPVLNPDEPIEVLRVIHAFDPCLSCAVHMMRPDSKPVVVHTGGGC
jgi:hydrogenase large subunit